MEGPRFTGTAVIIWTAFNTAWVAGTFVTECLDNLSMDNTTLVLT